MACSGCLAIQGFVGLATVTRPTARRLWVDNRLGGACKQFASVNAADRRPSKLSRLDAATFVVCADNTVSVGALVEDHFGFDDQMFDHLTAGIIAIDCALDQFNCGKNSVLAIASGYAKRVDPAAADRALAAIGAAQNIRDEFHDRLESARKTIAERVAKLDPQMKAIWLDRHESDKIDSIRADGTISYRVDCHDGATHKEYDAVPPIEVPAAQASGVRPGATVEAWVSDTNVGEVSFVHFKDAVVQVRGHALRAAVAHGYVSSR